MTNLFDLRYKSATEGISISNKRFVLVFTSYLNSPTSKTSSHHGNGCILRLPQDLSSEQPAFAELYDIRKESKPDSLN